jgi:hypothetical protein
MHLGNLTNAEIRVMHEFKMQPSELNNLPFYYFNNLIEFIKLKDEQSNNENSNSKEYTNDPKVDINKQMKAYNKGFKMPKMPNLPKMK